MHILTKKKLLKGWAFEGLSPKEITSRTTFYLLILSVLILGGFCTVHAIRWIDKPFGGFLVNQRMVVGNFGQYHWTGTQAGLRYTDKILKANNQAVYSMRDLEQVINKTNIGGPITYTIGRGKEVFEVTIPTMRFTGADLFMTFGIFFFQAVLYLIIGVIVFILKPDIKVSWLFFMMCFLVGMSYLLSFDAESTHFGFVRLYMVCNTFLAALILHFSLLFPEESALIRKPYIQVIPYVISTILIIPLELIYPDPSFITVHRFVLIYLFLSVFALIISTLHAFLKRSSTLARQRAKVILFGAALALPPMLAPLVASMGVTFGGVKIITNFSSIPRVIFPASIAYAIAKHNLFDVDVYIKRAVGYGLMTILVGAGYLLMQTTLDSFVMRPLFGEAAEKVYPILFAVLVVFFFNPVNRRVQASVDRLFYRKKFDYKETVISVSNALTSVLDLTEIVKKIIHTVKKEMFIDTAGIILSEPRKKACQTFFLSEDQDATREEIKTADIPCDDPLLSLLSREKRLITKYDIEENHQYVTVRESCGQRFSEMGASIAIPIIYQGEVKGALALGHKKSGHFYTREDIDLLETLASHGAVALENARMAEQMKNEEMVRTNLARYLSPQIVDQVIKKDVQVNLGGDRKVVTVLFSDIRNFTTITETMPPDRLVHILNEYFTEMAGIIFEHQGSLDKYIGDAIVAVFGSLIPLENSAKSAVNAALRMMKRMPALSEKWSHDYGVKIEIGIGINTGEVFLGNIGSPERMEFTVIGDTVNVASRFSGLAKPGQILITRETLAVLGSDIPYKELPPSEVKGKTGKLEVFEVPYS